METQWCPSRLEDTHRAVGSQLWPGRWSGDGCRQREKRKLPEMEPTFTRALGPTPLHILPGDWSMLRAHGFGSPSLQCSWLLDTAFVPDPLS